MPYSPAARDGDAHAGRLLLAVQPRARIGAPGYYQVFLDRYGVDAQLSSTLRCAFHKYTYPAGAAASLLADLQRSNEHVRAWDIRKEGDNVFAGWQQTGEKMYFYAVANRPVTGIEPVVEGDREVRIVRFGEGDGALELRIGFSFVSEKNARENLEAEMLGKSFAEVRSEATATWNDLLGRIRVEGGTERERGCSIRASTVRSSGRRCAAT